VGQGGTIRAGDYNFFPMGMETKINWEQNFWYTTTA